MRQWGGIETVINSLNDISSTIASAVEEQTATAAEIERNMKVAAEGTSQATENTEGVVTAAQSTTEGAAQTKDASGELSQMAHSLKKIVERLESQQSNGNGHAQQAA